MGMDLDRLFHVCQVTATVDKSMLETTGGGDVEVLSTPAMVALMERAAVQCMSGLVGDGETSVSTQMEVSHIAAVPEGGEITASAEVISQSGRRVTLKVFCEDCGGIVGKGTHVRLVVNRDRFQKRADAKRINA